MRLVIAAVGRWRGDPSEAVFAHYRRRLDWPLTLREVEAKGAADPGAAPAREAPLLLKAAGPGPMVALDGDGQTLDSPGLAARLGAWRDGGEHDASFVIGGAHGLDATVRDRARLVLSLGPMTWPHLMVRAMLAEQLYRARQILAGHPYHHG